MSLTLAEEKRALSADEFALVVQTHYPTLDELTPDALKALAKQLREARDRATDLARQQRREQRGKAAPRGKTAAAGNAGQTLKKAIFASALKRVNRRQARIVTDAKRAEHIAAAHRALQRAQEAQGNATRFSPGRTAGKGMRVVGNTRPTVGINPAERGRVSQFVKNAQAKRDK